MKRTLLAIPLCLLAIVAYAGSQGIVQPVRPGMVRFTENKGQWDSRVLFRTSVPGGNVLLEKDALYYFLYSDDDMAKVEHHPGTHSPVNVRAHAVRAEIVGATLTAKIEGSIQHKDYVNYYIGNNPSKWASDVKIYGQVNYAGIYNHIDLKVYSVNEQLKYDFVVRPGGTLAAIKLRYVGADKIMLRKGIAYISTSVGDIMEQKPYAYQDIDGKRIEVPCQFVLNGNELSFALPHGYNTAYPLVIDPTIVFSTYTGSTTDNWGYTATYDNDGSMYLGGYVYEPGVGQFYPTTPGAFQVFFAGGTGSANTPNIPPGSGNGIEFACDMGITKFTPDGTQLVYSTYLGGRDNETPHSLIVDAQGNLIIYGVSYSDNYPISSGAYDASYNGQGDIVVTKFNANGTALIGSTYVGGSEDDGLNYDPDEFTLGNLKRNYGDQNRGEVNIDATGNIYVASCTKSANYPVTSGALQPNFGGTQDGCVFKLNSACTQLLWSTFLGGNSDDACYSLEPGPNNAVYVAGGTMSSDFRTTAGVINPTYLGGNYDGFVARINANNGQLLASTYMGTMADDQVFMVKLDIAGDVYFMGQTTGQFPVQNAVYSNPNSGQFIVKANPQLTSVIYSTVFGNGNNIPNISPTAFLVDTCENVYVAGWGSNGTLTSQFNANLYGLPITSDAIKSNTDGTDFYFIVISKNAQELLYASYFGGDHIPNVALSREHVDGGTSRFDKRGVIYQAMCAGCGRNSLTPTTPGVWSPNNMSRNCNELGLKMEFNLNGTNVELDAYPRATGCVPLTVQFQGTINNATSFTWYFGDGSTSQQQNPQHTFTDTGTYNVMLVGIDPNSCNVSDTAYIDVWVRDDSISANFSADINIDCDSNKVFLVSRNFPTTQYHWDMGDGTIYTNDSVTHYYATRGSYNITLIVTDSTKCSLADTFSTSIFIPYDFTTNFHLADSIGCIPLRINFGAPVDSAISYVWHFGDGTVAAGDSVAHTYTQGGTYVAMLVATNPSSCNVNDTAYANILAKDSFAHADFTMSRIFYGCDSVRVTVVSTYQGEDAQLWDFGDGFTSTADSVSHTYVDSGVHIITHTLYHAIMVCKPIDTFQLAVSLGKLNIEIILPDSIGCIPFTPLLIGNSDLMTTDYWWDFGDGTTGFGTSVTHTYPVVGTYNIVAFGLDTNACVFYDTAWASVTAINDSTIAVFNASVLNSCDSNLLVQLTNQSINGVEYLWDFGDGNTSTAVDTTYSYRLPGTYVITLTAIDTSRCHPIDTATFSVTLLPNSYVNFVATNVCHGTITQFDNLGSTSATYLWQFGDDSTSTLYEPSHLYNAPGVYQATLTITDTGTCDVTSSITKPVNVYTQPQASFTTAKDTFKFETPVEFINTSQYYQHLMWDFGDGQSTMDEETPIHIYGKIYQMTVCLNAYNEACNDTFCKNIFISFDALMGVPNAFSPNGDGVNDVIRVEGKGIVELEFRIYNRWGEKVFESKDKSIGWDGYYKGVLQEMEAYTYSVQAKFIDGSSKQLKGNITLLR